MDPGKCMSLSESCVHGDSTVSHMHTNIHIKVRLKACAWEIFFAGLTDNTKRFFSFTVTETVTHIVCFSIDASARRTHLTPHIRPGGLTSCVTLHMEDKNEICAWQENVQLLHTVEVKLPYQICGRLISIIRVLYRSEFSLSR